MSGSVRKNFRLSANAVNLVNTRRFAKAVNEGLQKLAWTLHGKGSNVKMKISGQRGHP